MSWKYTATHYGAGFPPATGVYMAPMPNEWELIPATPMETITTLYMAQTITDSEPQTAQSLSEAAIVAEMVRRVLAGELSEKSRELLELVLERCEEAEECDT